MELSEYLKEVLPKFENYETAKDRLFVKCLRLSDVREGVDVYKTVGDIAVVVYLYIEHDDEKKALIASRVSKELLSECWHVEENDIIDHAIKNTTNIEKPMVYVIDISIGDFHRYSLDSLEACLAVMHEYFTCLTSEKHYIGSSMVFVPGVLDTFCNYAKVDYLYIAFTSKEEAMIHPVRDVENPIPSLDEMRDIIAGTDEVCGNESLSHEVYMYKKGDCKNGVNLTIAR